MLHSTGSNRDVNIGSFHANQRTCISSEMNEGSIPLENTLVRRILESTENGQKSLKSGLMLSGFYRPEKTLMGMFEGLESVTNKLSDGVLSVGQNEVKESKTMQVQENLSNENTTSADENPTKGKMHSVSSKPVLEIKKKYMEKLKATLSCHADLPMGCSTPQKDKAVQANTHFEKHLQQDFVKGMTCQVSIPEQPSESRTNTSQELQLNTLGSNGIVLTNEIALSDKPVTTSVDKKATCKETTRHRPRQNTRQKSESDICLPPLVIVESVNTICSESMNNSTCSESISAGVLNTQSKDEAARQCEAMGGLPDHAVPNVIKIQESMVENIAPQEPMDCCSMSQDEETKIFEGPMTDEINVSREDVEKTCSGIPCIGIDMYIEDRLQPQTFDAKGEDDDVGDAEVMALITGSTNTEVITPEELKNAIKNKRSQHAEPPVGKLSPPGEINHPSGCKESEHDDRCPTPTIDEKPYVYTAHASNKIDDKELSRSSTPVMDETPAKPVSTTLNIDSLSDYSIQSDIALQTHRTLQSLDGFLSTLQYKSSQVDSTNTNQTLSFPVIVPPTQILPDFNKKIITTKLSTQQVLQSESSEYLFISPFNDVLGVMQQSKQSHSVPAYAPSVSPLAKVQDTPLQQQHCHSSKPIPSTKGPVKRNDDEESSKTNTPACSISQHPFMAVRPSKSDNYGDVDPQDSPMQNSVWDHLQPKLTIKLSANKRSFVSDRPNDHSEHSALDHFASEKCRFASDKPGQQKLYVQQYADNLKASRSSSSSVQSFKLVKSTPKHVDGHDSLTEPLDDNIGIITHFGEDFLNKSTSVVDCKTNKITDGSLGSEGSLICTVSNTKRKRSPTFLEKASKRSMQDDQTRSSMDREYLIFLDEMKQVLKRGKQEHPGQQAQCDQYNLPFSSPVMVQFSNLEEQNDSFGDIEPPPSFVGQIISVDMSDREVLRNTPQKGNTSVPHPHGPLEHPGVSAVNTECASLYQSIMNKICSGKRITSLPKDFHMTEPDDSKADSSHYFDFCSQMKREMDDSFRSNLNSVVKTSCKKNNRFFLLVTSDDVFFDKTKDQLEAEGHVAVSHSDFFLGESSSSPLLIIIRNEDIAEHIFKVPQLLKLRMSPAVQFAGIDEPDDVGNLTYQEIFIKGGFVMFDGAAVQSLSPSNMKRASDILQNLSQREKWKWVLHYRDSRRLKENARLCVDAKEKGHLFNRCQEDGLLEILPYHECDLMSREQPDYLRCLCILQVRNISARYPVFVTDSATDCAFEKNGILTMTVNSFLKNSLGKNIYSLT